jgi:hypothetical protein
MFVWRSVPVREDYDQGESHVVCCFLHLAYVSPSLVFVWSSVLVWEDYDQGRGEERCVVSKPFPAYVSPSFETHELAEGAPPRMSSQKGR